MSDLYGTDDHSSFEQQQQPQSHEDMSVFLHNLLQSSPPATTTGDSSGAGKPMMMLDYRRSISSASLDFSDHGGFFGKERAERTFSSAAGGDFDAVTSSMNRGERSNANKELEASDSGGNQAQARSSKRSRSAEIHNLSEKKRRSRINEKLKALQNLIPNSNKTDKASMLDETIEYLKQLQLQVQMLTMRNGFSLHPNYVPGCLSPMQLPVQFDEGNVLPSTSRGAEIVSGNQEVVMQNMFGTNHPKGSSHQLLEPSTINNSSSRPSFGLESSFPSHYGLLNHLASAKDICRDDTLSHLPLDISCSGNNSSSGVSS